MPETLSVGSVPSVFSPLAKALLDGFSEGVVVFDSDGKLMYANHQAREALAGMDLADAGADLQPRLAAMGGRLRPLRVGSLELGEGGLWSSSSGRRRAPRSPWPRRRSTWRERCRCPG
jgi:PAS domain-containing protein